MTAPTPPQVPNQRMPVTLPGGTATQPWFTFFQLLVVASTTPVGTITEVIAGNGLSGGGSIGAVTLALALTQDLVEAALGYVPAPAGSLGIVSTNMAGSFTTQSAFNTYFVNTAAGPVTVTMNAAPKMNEVADIYDASGNAGTNPISFNGNGNDIAGASSVPDYIQIGYGHVRLIWNETQWLATN